MAAEHSWSQLVVVGSSAGGIEALLTLVASLPRDFPAPIVLAQHLDPRHLSHLGEILTRRSTLPIRSVEDREPLEPGVVYVVPANRHVMITDHELRVIIDADNRPKPSIDLLFKSAADIFGDQLIAVVLTGSGSDGTAGARRVKEAGGTVVIQNPQTASFPAMPRSLAPTTVDVVAELEAIGPLLNDLLTGSLVLREPDDEALLQRLLGKLRNYSGIDFSTYKRPTLQRRLAGRIATTGNRDLAAYIEYLESHPDEYQRLVSSFLIKVTEFFRDPALFTYMREEVLPELVRHARARGDTVRLWSAGCSTGEEAYSLAILVSEILGTELSRFNVRIFATDLDTEAIAFARRAMYPAAALAGMDPNLVGRYFTEVDGAYELHKRVRSLAVFGEHDLARRAPFPQIDLVLCRNVLIYFTPELQQRALQLFAFSLRDGGYLALGKAETTTPLTEAFVPVQAALKVYRRQGERTMLPIGGIPYVAIPAPHSMRVNTLLSARHQQHGHPGPSDQPIVTPPGRAEDLIRHLPIGVVIVDGRYDIKSINGVARRLFGIHTAAIGDDFLHLQQSAPSGSLRGLIDAALQGASGTLDEVETTTVTPGETRYLQIHCAPHTAEETDRQPADGGCFATALVVVSDRTDSVRKYRETLDQQSSELVQNRQEIVRMTALIDQLTTTNTTLRAANEELTAATMELRSANEEFLVDNEEIQASSEETETLYEEMQATNEELETLNEELQATVEELHTANEDLNSRGEELQTLATKLEVQRHRLAAILSTMREAVLVVDRQGKHIFSSASFHVMFGQAGSDLVPEDDEGNPLPGAMTPMARAMRGETFGMEFTLPGREGSRRWFEANGQPILNDKPDEASVIVIRDITDRNLRRMQNEFMSMASHELRTPLTAMQGHLELLRRWIAPYKEDARLQHAAELALEQSRRMGALVRDLTDATRLQTGKFSLTLGPVDLTSLITRAVELIQATAPGQVFTVNTPEPLYVRGDAARLQQVLLNLLSNAVTYAPNGKRVDVRMRRVGSQAEIEVQDYGPGIAAADIPLIFTRFYQSVHKDQPIGGLGLGLFIAKELVAAHGGSLTVQSTEAEGATFTIALPIIEVGPSANESEPGRTQSSC